MKTISYFGIILLLGLSSASSAMKENRSITAVTEHDVTTITLDRTARGVKLVTTADGKVVIDWDDFMKQCKHIWKEKKVAKCKIKLYEVRIWSLADAKAVAKLVKKGCIVEVTHINAYALGVFTEEVGRKVEEREKKGSLLRDPPFSKYAPDLIGPFPMAEEDTKVYREAYAEMVGLLQKKGYSIVANFKGSL